MPHVLLVDDDPETLAWLSEFVKAEGFTVATADSLRAARIQLTRLAPDILITDLILPDGQGIELVNDLESRDATEFVVMTGYASTESAIASGESAPMSRPTGPFNLLRSAGALSSSHASPRSP